MPENNNELDKEIEDGLVRADKMLRRQRIQRGALALLGILAMVGVFWAGRSTASVPLPTATITTLTPIPTFTRLPTKTRTPKPILMTSTATSAATSDVQTSATTNPYGTLMTSKSVTIKSDDIWHDTEIQVEMGDWVVTKYSKGIWTIDFNYYPYVDGRGYSSKIPENLCAGCSAPMVNKPLGQLIYKLGENSRGVIGNGATFQASEAGNLLMMINDYYQALGDNAGSITIDISIYRP